jgi:hypothetical protein
MQGNLQAIFGDQGFNPNSVEPRKNFGVMPPGEYPVLIETAEYKQTSKGDGHLVALTLVVLDGQYAGRKIFDNINIDNPNPQTVGIALETFGELGRAIGVEAIKDTDQLLNQIVIVKAVVKKDNVYGEKNAVAKYMSPNEAQPQAGDAGLPAPTAESIRFTASQAGRAIEAASAPSVQPAAVAAPQAAGPVAPSPAGPAASGSPGAQQTAPWMRPAA